MAFVISVAAGLASCILALAVAGTLHSVLKDRWRKKSIDQASTFFCLFVVGTPAYAVAAITAVGIITALTIHFIIACIFVSFVALDVLNYVEGLLLAIILCTLISILVETIS